MSGYLNPWKVSNCLKYNHNTTKVYIMVQIFTNGIFEYVIPNPLTPKIYDTFKKTIYEKGAFMEWKKVAIPSSFLQQPCNEMKTKDVNDFLNFYSTQ